MAWALPSDLMDSCSGGLMYCMSKWAYDVTGGVFWGMALLAFAVVLFMGTQRFGTPRAFGYASVSGLMGAIFLAVLQLMPWWLASVFIITGVIGFAVMILNER